MLCDCTGLFRTVHELLRSKALMYQTIDHCHFVTAPMGPAKSPAMGDNNSSTGCSPLDRGDTAKPRGVRYN